MEKGKFTKIGFVMMESHMHIKENPKASTRYDGQSLSFQHYQTAGSCLLVECVWTKVVTERMESTNM